MQQLNQSPPSADPASLNNLHDIVVPDPVAWWPPAPGWYVLAVAILVTGGLIVSRAVSLYRANRYRREARMQLEQLSSAGSDDKQRVDAIVQANELLKRVALAAWPRESVAALSGQRWVDFLKRTGGPNIDEQASHLRDLVYCRQRSEQLSPAQVQDLFNAADHWVRSHDRSVSISSIQTEDEEC